ncbi:RHS repeat-associated core domain-containing protein, partial [Pedobacter sp.]|uniref:RHS repeat-associated core domain-containing protein n=1 Tax=Pedobacter sp. TaxID=1411316 RepID=UPI002CB9594E
KYQFNGKEKQDQEKMYDYGARFYDPVIGRWNVVDPLGEKAYDVNLYVYVDNNTVNNLDPTGMETLYGQEAKDAFIKEKEKFLKGDDNNGPGDPIKGRNIVNTKGIIFRKDFKGILYTTFHVQDNKFSAYLQKRIEILEAIEKNNRADHRVGHFNFATGKINGWGGIEPNYFFESIFIGGKLLEGGGLIYESLAAKGGGQLFEVADGVRRAKAAQQLGYETIDAMDNTGNIFQVPIKNLSSPMKSSIDISNPLNQLRYDRIYNGMKAGDKLPPIYVNPGNRGVSIFNVVFKQ